MKAFRARMRKGIKLTTFGIDSSEIEDGRRPQRRSAWMFGFTREKRRPTDWASFESEVLPHHADLYRMAMWLLRNRDQAEDLVQETFVAALRSFHRFERGTNCRAWLIKIMYYTLSKRRRAEGRLHIVSDTEDQIAETVAFVPPTPQSINEEEVLAALERLPQQFQEVVILSDVEDMSYKEIAGALSIPTGTVMSRLHRGRRLLRAELAAYANSLGIGKTAEAKNSLRLAAKQEGGKSNAM
jgi:RNA polymerase sigma-70 factor (ECF subfamily)